jgi:hypothetical protein
LTRGDPRALSLTENVFDLFSDEAINWDAASSIGKIAAPTEVLTKTNYAATKVRADHLSKSLGGVLIAYDHPVPCHSEVYERVVTAIDEECPRFNRSVSRDFAIDVELTIGRPCGSDGPSFWVIFTHKGDTQGDLCP